MGNEADSRVFMRMGRMFCICGREIPRSLGALTNALVIVLFLLHHVDTARLAFHAASLPNYDTFTPCSVTA
jgi:uncharacterized membrane protein